MNPWVMSRSHYPMWEEPFGYAVLTLPQLMTHSDDYTSLFTL